MGYVPDVPSVQDYTPETPSIAKLISMGNVSAGEGGVQTVSSSGGTAVVAVSVPVIAAQVDLRPYFSPIEDQGQLGSCTANSAVALVEYFERRSFDRHIDGSRLFTYKATRNLLGWVGDQGAYLRTTMGALALFGVLPEKFWPYEVAKFDVEPTAFCYAFASDYKAMQYFRLDPNGASPATVLQNIKNYLNAGYPSMFGFPAYDEFMRPVGAKVAYPAPKSKLNGGHAIVAAGYDDNMMIGADKGALLIRNSWGTGWGDHGYAWMSYRYVTEGLAVDWWSLVKADWVDSGQFGVVV